MCKDRFRKVIYFSRRETNPEKAGVTFCGLISFVLTITFTILFAMKLSKASNMGDEYYCTDFRTKQASTDDPYYVPKNVGEAWKFIFLTNLILYGLLSLFSLFAMVGGFVPVFRIMACCGYFFAAGYYIFVAIYTIMYRFSAAGIYCSHAPYPGGVFNEHGEFLRKASISHWVLLCPLICLGTSGMNTIKQEGAE